MKKVLFGITWASFHNIYWIPLLGIALSSVFWAWKKRKKLIAFLVAPQWTKTMIEGISSKRELTKTVLYAVAFIVCFLALLQPQWGEKEHVVEQEGRELFVALDISRSMLASDVKPHRLAFAKSKIKKLLKLLPSERVGLLVFSGGAVVQCPLTRDSSAFKMFLDQVDVETISSGTTSLEQAISKIIHTMKKMPTRKNKILVVFTDGEDFSSDLARVREEAKEIGLHIFTYGVGTEKGAPIPVLNDSGSPIGYEKNEQGNVIMSRLNEGILQSLARESGGRYISPTQGDEDLKSLVSDVEKYEKEKFEDKELSREEDRYPYFLAVAFVCLLIEWLI